MGKPGKTSFAFVEVTRRTGEIFAWQITASRHKEDYARGRNAVCGKEAIPCQKHSFIQKPELESVP